MPDWTRSMKQTFEYYTVDPGTWANAQKIDTITKCTLQFDSDSDTLGSATIEGTESIGEEYIRVYLITTQDGTKESFSLGTFLIQTPNTSFDGKVETISFDAYTPLIELKEKYPALGYSIFKDTNVMSMAYKLTSENVRAPVVEPKNDEKLYSDFVADPSETWLSFIVDLMANAKYHFILDELGRILFSPDQETASLQPVCTFDDSNSSILYPDIEMTRDLYGIPNVVEVIYSDSAGYINVRVVNNDKNSLLSTVNRGREIIYRVTDPDVTGTPTEGQLKLYAQQTLEDLSALENTITYTHGYRPVRVGDCVRLDYEKAGLSNVKAKVTSQSIECVPGCPVTETAVYTENLWKAG